MTEHTNKKKWLVILITIAIVAVVGIGVKVLQQRVTTEQQAAEEFKTVECSWMSSIPGNTNFTVSVLDASGNVLKQENVNHTVISASEVITYTLYSVPVDIPNNGYADIRCQVVPIQLGGQTCTNLTPPPPSQPERCISSGGVVPTNTPTPTGTITPTPTGTLTPTVAPTATIVPTGTITPTPTLICPANTNLNVEIICANCTGQ